MSTDRTDEGWKTATFQLDPDDDLKPLSDGARALEAHAEALRSIRFETQPS